MTRPRHRRGHAAGGALAIPSPAPARIAALDAARALGVFAMILGHTCDALLSASARATPAAQTYWKARGLTAPLFLLVSGWAVTVAIGRSPARGPGVVRQRLPRVLLLLAIGSALRWPGWDVPGLLAGLRAGGGLPLQHLLAFDALHAIAAGLLLASLALALPWSRRELGLAFLALAALAVALGLRPQPAQLPRGVLALAVAQALGGTSPFPAVPWVAYFFAGGAIPLLAGDAPAARTLQLGALGALLVAATAWTGVGVMPPTHPALILFRIGVVLLLLAALAVVRPGLAGALAPVGRRSLALYALHLPAIYGWSTFQGLAQRVGPQLGFAGAALVGLAVFVACWTVWALARWLAARCRSALAGARRQAVTG